MKSINSINFNLTSNSVTTINLFFKQLSFLLVKNNLNPKIKIFVLPKKIKKYTLLKSPHVHKTAWTQLENRSYKAHYTLQQFSQAEKIKIRKIINFIIKNLPTNILLKLKTNQLQYI